MLHISHFFIIIPNLHQNNCEKYQTVNNNCLAQTELDVLLKFKGYEIKFKYKSKYTCKNKGKINTIWFLNAVFYKENYIYAAKFQPHLLFYSALGSIINDKGHKKFVYSSIFFFILPINFNFLLLFSSLHNKYEIIQYG